MGMSIIDGYGWAGLMQRTVRIFRDVVEDVSELEDALVGTGVEGLDGEDEAGNFELAFDIEVDPELSRKEGTDLG